MKKLLSLVLVLAVVLSTMSFAFAAAPSDLGDYKYADAVKKLVGLGIINGYPDGTFKPTGNITRAEFAKVVVTALGYADAATAAGDAKFADMNGHWAVGFVNVASSLGIINGVGGGKFAPDANVKYEEAVTMIVRALGYEPAAKSNGGYPNGYLTIASQKKITKDIAMVAGTIADRGTVAKLMAESLEVPFLKQTGYGTLTTFSEAKDGNGDATESLLITGLKLTKYTPTVDSFDAAKKTVTFTGYDVDNKKTVNYVDPIDPTATKNCKVTVWYKDGTVYSFKNETTVRIDRLKKVNGTDDDKSNDVATATLKKVELQNGGEFDTEKDKDGNYTYTLKVNDGDLSGNVKNVIGDYAKLYLKDNKIYRIETFDLGSAGLIAEATATKIKYQNYGNNDVYLPNIDNNADLLYVFIDGVEKSVADLKADMYFQFNQINNKKLVIAASTGKVTGKLTAFSKDTATVGGTKYDTRGNNVTGKDGNGNDVNYISYNNGTKFEKNILDDLVNVDVTAYKDFENKLAFIKGTATSSTTDFWALVNSIQTEGKSLTVVRSIDGVSTEVTYSVKTDTDENKGLDAAYTSWATIVGLGAGDKTANDAYGNMNNRIFKIVINSENKVTKIQTIAQASKNGLETELTAGDVTKFNKDTGIVENADGNFYGDSATVFNLKDDKVVTWNDIKDKRATLADVAYALNKDNTQKAEIVAILGTTYDTINATDKFYAYVKDEAFDGTYYNITAADGTVLKLHKDNASGFKDMAKDFITYVKDGDNIKVKAVTAAVYDAVAANGSFDAVAGSVVNNASNSLVASSFVKVDGDFVVIGASTYVKKAAGLQTIKITWKSDKSVDEALVSDVTSISNGNKVLVVKDSDGLARAIYYWVQ